MTGLARPRTVPVELAPGRLVGGDLPLLLVAGPCVIEGEAALIELAGAVGEICDRLGVPWIFKASYDKANRTALGSFRGPGLDEGLRALAAVRRAVGVPVLTDVHQVSEVGPAAEVVDVLQVPAFLCRQTDLVAAVGAAGRGVNLKRGQFLAPEDMAFAAEKARAGGATRVTVTERGTSFGHRDLVFDPRAIPLLAETGAPVLFDATHSVQRPGAAGGETGGARAFIPPLARAAVAAGADGLYLEVHPDPARARSDAATQLPLGALPALLEQVLAVAAAVGRRG